MKFSKYALMLSISASIIANAAMAENTDVVRDTNQNIIKNSFDNCVRTKWKATSDECAEPTTTPIHVSQAAPQSRKPIKRSRSYLVFFDFDKSNLTPSATDIIKKANAEAHNSSQEVNFSITGHADRSGSDEYNMKLSKRRADAVKNELVKLGTNSRDIESTAKGESEPLVPTADGVKEPQNRRVEIIYSVEE